MSRTHRILRSCPSPRNQGFAPFLPSEESEGCPHAFRVFTASLLIGLVDSVATSGTQLEELWKRDTPNVFTFSLCGAGRLPRLNALPIPTE